MSGVVQLANAAQSGPIVVALGGNAITRAGDEGTVVEDIANLKRSLASVVRLVERGYRVVLTHGNGPQVGNQMLRVELSRGKVPDLPLDIVVADLQGGLGYMIERVLRNLLRAVGIEIPVCALLTQVEVDRDDPAFDNPEKFVGPVFSREEIDSLVSEFGWLVREDVGRGWRRVVPSPRPIGIVEAELVRKLVEWGALTIVTGGGGIPVTRSADRTLSGVEAVIDKDLAAAEVGRVIEASDLFILTSVEHVMVGFGTPEQRPLRYLDVQQVKELIEQGEFAAGSMLPKMEAACRFLESGGSRVLVTDVFALDAALDGHTGTWITP